MAIPSVRARPGGLLLAAALSLAGPALAQPALPPPHEPAALAAPPQEPARSVALFGALGYDYGFTKTVEARFADGSTQRLAANGGFALALGAGFFRVLEGRLETRATFGVKYDAIRAKNGSVTFLAFPLEVVELWNLAPLRLGAGLSLSLAPRLRGEGLAQGLDVDFEHSLGFLFQAEYVWRLGPNRAVLAGPRFLLQRMRAKDSGVVDGTNALGVQIGMTL